MTPVPSTPDASRFDLPLDPGDRLLAELEAWLWSGELLPRSDVATVARWTESLSDLYTIGRGVLTRSQADPAHLGAKLRYFLASDAPKVALGLAEAAARDAAFRAPARVVDIGCGVGATSVGLLLWWVRQREREGSGELPGRLALTGIDRARSSLELWSKVVQRAADLAGVPVDLQTQLMDGLAWSPVDARGAAEADLVLCQAALNELLQGNHGEEVEHEPATLAAVGAWARGAPVLLIEPALRLTTRALQRLRDRLLAEGGVRVVAPCPHSMPCPMLAHQRDWCHESRRIVPSPMVEAVQAITKRRDERSLFSFLALAPGGESPVERSLWRLVSDPLGSRGKTERWVCCGDGRLRCVRVLDKERSTGNAALVEGERGTLVETSGDVPDRVGPDVVLRVR